MGKLIELTYSFSVGDEDVLIDDGDQKILTFYKDPDDGCVLIKAATIDGVVKFWITPRMAKELVEKLGSMIDD